MALHLEGDGDRARGSVDVVYTLAARDGERERAEYDYLINATGLKLNFAATPGRSRPSEGAHVQKVEEGRRYYETLDGDEGTLDLDFAMLLPPFRWRGPAGIRWPGR